MINFYNNNNYGSTSLPAGQERKNNSFFSLVNSNIKKTIQSKTNLYDLESILNINVDLNKDKINITPKSIIKNGAKIIIRYDDLLKRGILKNLSKESIVSIKPESNLEGSITNKQTCGAKNNFKIKEPKKNLKIVNKLSFLSKYKYITSISKFNSEIASYQSINYKFNNSDKKQSVNNIYLILKYAFKSMSCLISKPYFVHTPDKVTIQLFYFVKENKVILRRRYKK